MDACGWARSSQPRIEQIAHGRESLDFVDVNATSDKNGFSIVCLTPPPGISLMVLKNETQDWEQKTDSEPLLQFVATVRLHHVEYT